MLAILEGKRKMKYKCKKWLKSTAGKISIVLLTISIAFLVLAFSSLGNFTARTANNINNVLIGIATNLLGIIVTVSFVQYFIDKQGEQIECDKEWEKILLYNRTLTILLERYELFHNNVVTTSEKFEASDKTLKTSFSFNDICDLYEQCRYITEGIYEPAIAVFYKSEEQVRDYMMRMLENISFKYYKEIGDAIEKFVQVSYQNDVKGYILQGLSLSTGSKKEWKEVVRDYIKDTEIDWIKVISESKTANAMGPYVALYYLLQEEAKTILTYRSLIANEIQKRKL